MLGRGGQGDIESNAGSGQHWRWYSWVTLLTKTGPGRLDIPKCKHHTARDPIWHVPYQQAARAMYQCAIMGASSGNECIAQVISHHTCTPPLGHVQQQGLLPISTEILSSVHGQPRSPCVTGRRPIEYSDQPQSCIQLPRAIQKHAMCLGGPTLRPCKPEAGRGLFNACCQTML